jgi:hypothetical protein
MPSLCPLCDRQVAGGENAFVHHIACPHCGTYRISVAALDYFSARPELWRDIRHSLAEAAKEKSVLGSVLEMLSPEDVLKVANAEALVDARESW